MRSKPFHLLPWLACLAVWLLGAWSARAITASTLHDQLAQGVKLTLIDVRPTALFSQGHIPGAMNIPAPLCSQKNLPPLGKVVVYGAGLGNESQESAAAAALGQKPGITVDVLEGGFAAWESAQGLTTRPRGMKSESPNYITYAQLKAAKSDDVVLVDLRRQRAPQPALSSANAGQPLTDLAQTFPGLQVAKSTSEAKPQTKSAGKGSGAPPLLVLIDDGDGTAEQTARALKNNGTKRYAILAGGELILARQGQPGLQRGSAGNHSPDTALAPGAVK